MIKDVRSEYNGRFTNEKYESFVQELNKAANCKIDFRVCETSLFLSEELTEKLKTACFDIIAQLDTDEYRKYSLNGVPKHLSVPGCNDKPLFLQIDFAIALDESGNHIPKLIELQGFPSLYGFQAYYQEIYEKFMWKPDGFTGFYNGLTLDSYKELLKKTILNGHLPENVILLEIDPLSQKTLVDFVVTEQYTGIKTVCISDIIKKGKKLFYMNQGKEIHIKRIYNRVIFDELDRKETKFAFSFQEELEVEWAGHPDWFYRISKYSLPYLKGINVPECYFLSDLTEYPSNLENFVLKPLYSFAGVGVDVEVTKEKLDSITDRNNYILQQKVDYAPLILTPEGYSKCEIRMMFIWDDKPLLVNNLSRMSKGKMMGVDFNKNKTWVGSGTAFHKE